MEQKIKLSSILIAKNEEKNISQCIESQLNCVDEIIILVDNKTHDNTFEIAKSFQNLKCELVDWMGFAKTKQKALSKTSNDWVLWIDADEVITKELSKELIEFKNSEPKYSAYSIPRIANFLGRWIKHSGWYPGRVTRLFNKNFASFSDNHVHEELIINGNVGELKSDILHYTDPSIKHYFNKFNSYTSLAAEELRINKKHFKITDILLRPFFIFIKMYFIKLGFLDGLQGFILAVFSSAYVFTKYCKFWELNNNKNNEN